MFFFSITIKLLTNIFVLLFCCGIVFGAANVIKINEINNNGGNNGNNNNNNDETSSTRHNEMSHANSETTPSSIRMRPNNEYDQIKYVIKHAADGLSQKMEFHNSIYLNEMLLLTNTIGSFSSGLRDLKGKMQTLEILHHQIDELTDYKNNIEQKLNRMNAGDIDNHAINNKLLSLENTVNHLHSDIDNLLERDRHPNSLPNSKQNDNKKVPNTNNLQQTETSAEQNINCESKIDHLITFVHNFAEINRLESSDILNRLSNMQTQLIHFFDVDKASLINLRDKLAKNRTQAIDNVLRVTEEVISLNETDQLMNGSKEKPNISELNTNPLEIENKTASILIPDIQSIKMEPVEGGRHIRDISSYFDSNKYFYPSQSQCEQTLAVCNNLYNNKIINRKRQATTFLNQKRDETVAGNILTISNHRSAKYGQASRYGCHQFKNVERPDSVYRFNTIEPNQNGNGFIFNERLCSFDLNGIAYTVIQKRDQSAQGHQSENFNRSWNDYKNGFGDFNGDFWYGNDFIHRLTYDDDMELKIILENWDNQQISFEYEVFRVDSERNHYNLFIGGYRGNNKSLDAMAYHNNQDFSTFDQQYDKSGISSGTCCSCSTSYASGWWFNNCIEANLNGIYQLKPRNNNYVGIIWEHWLGDYSLKSTKMMIRPKIQWNNTTISNEDSGKPPADP